MPAARSSVVEAEAAGGEAVMVASTDADDAAPAPAAPGSSGGAPIAAGPVATDARTAAPVLKEQVVVEAWLSVQVEDASETARALRALVEKSEGRVVSEQVSGAAESWSASMQLRLPPRAVSSVVDWLNGQGEITSKRIQGTDVSKTLFDQQIALDNLTLTLERLRKLLDAGGLQMKDIL
ncbi:MAG TPA: DUF4349 domain-containing protein, partial [Kofleriaceae bacterium]